MRRKIVGALCAFIGTSALGVGAHTLEASMVNQPIVEVAQPTPAPNDCWRQPAGFPPPAGAVIVTPQDDAVAALNSHGAGTVYWFAPGAHLISGSLLVEDNDQLLGGPGAFLDGAFQGANAAIKGGGDNVTIAGLTIIHFGSWASAVNTDAAVVNRAVRDGWKILDSRFEENDGVALFLGSHSLVSGSCFIGNGQSGLAVPKRGKSDFANPIVDVTIQDSAFINNGAEFGTGLNCGGCSAGMKFWAATTVTVRNNVVRGNHLQGIWFDNNNADVLIENNQVVDNDGSGIMYESSYNATIRNNTFSGNAVQNGQQHTFPIAALFISTSGGHSGVPGSPEISVTGNSFSNDYNALTVFEDPNRFCGSVTDTSVGACTRTGGTIQGCQALAMQHVSYAEFARSCRWSVQNIKIESNSFGAPSPACVSEWCGRVSFISGEFSGDLKFRGGPSTRVDWGSSVIIESVLNGVSTAGNSTSGLTLSRGYALDHVTGTF